MAKKQDAKSIAYDLENSLRSCYCFKHTTLTQIRKDIKSYIKAKGDILELKDVKQTVTDFELDFEAQIDGKFLDIQVYYAKCRTRKIFITEIDVGPA